MMMDAIYLARFWPKVDKNGPGGCWLWVASRFVKTGYGQFWFREKNVTAHRASYGLFVGHIPEGWDVHHSCHVRACVNPDHLVLVSRQEHGRLHSPNTGKQFCKRGHEFTPENTYIYPDGGRKCITCRDEQKRAFDAKRRKPRAIANALKTHCKHGHEFTPENTHIAPNGSRQCKECRRIRDRARWPMRRNIENQRRRERVRLVC